MGWSAPVQMVTGSPIFDPEARIWTGCHIPDKQWILESSTGEAGNALHWLGETMFRQDGASPETTYELMDRLALSVPPGAEGVLASIGPSAMDMSHLGLGFGGFLFPVPLSAGGIHRAHLVRAVLENICFAIRANKEQLKEVSSMPISRVSIGGGLARSRCLQQILPSVLDMSICVVGISEVSGLGAAMCAAVGSGIYDTIEEAVTSMAPELRVIPPEPLAAMEYEDNYQRWLSAVQGLKKLSEGIK